MVAWPQSVCQWKVQSSLQQGILTSWSKMRKVALFVLGCLEQLLCTTLAVKLIDSQIHHVIHPTAIHHFIHDTTIKFSS